jgi:hypothetical protein
MGVFTPPDLKRFNTEEIDMTRKIFAGVSTIFALLTFICAAPALAAEFSADLTVTSKETGETSASKVYVKDGKVRQETATAKGTPRVIIFRPDKDFKWVVMPEKKMFMEYAYNADENPVRQWSPQGKPNLMQTGTQTVNGFACKKYEYTLSGGKGETITTWVADELNYPIKSKGGPIEFELKNILTGGVADTLFEAPAGFLNWT